MRKILKYNIACGIMIIALALTACSDLYGTHEKYLKMAEDIYIGQAESFEANSGFNRIQLEWKLSADPKVSTCEITWTDSEQPLVIAADRSTELMSTIIDLPEGIYTFTMKMKSESGKESLPQTVTGEVFGSKYQSRLPQKTIKSMTKTDKGIKIVWMPEENCTGVRLVYAALDGSEKNRVVVNEEEEKKDRDVLEATIEDALPGSEFKMSSVYKPNEKAIDYIESKVSTFTFPE